MNRRFTLALGVLAALILTGCQVTEGSTAGEPATIVVSEVGRATAPPDVLTINFGINTRAPAASQALSANDQNTQALIKALRDKGATQARVDPRQLSVFPNSDPNQTQVTDYEAVNQVVATSRNLGDAGALIDAGVAVAPDAIRVLGLTYEVDSTAAVYASARKDALMRAKDRAEQLAAAAGVKLGRLQAVKESEGDFPVAPFFEEGEPPGGHAEEPPQGSETTNGEGKTEIALKITAVYEVDD